MPRYAGLEPLVLVFFEAGELVEAEEETRAFGSVEVVPEVEELSRVEEESAELEFVGSSEGAVFVSSDMMVEGG